MSYEHGQSGKTEQLTPATKSILESILAHRLTIRELEIQAEQKLRNLAAKADTWWKSQNLLIADVLSHKIGYHYQGIDESGQPIRLVVTPESRRSVDIRDIARYIVLTIDHYADTTPNNMKPPYEDKKENVSIGYTQDRATQTIIPTEPSNVSVFNQEGLNTINYLGALTGMSIWSQSEKPSDPLDRVESILRYLETSVLIGKQTTGKIWNTDPTPLVLPISSSKT